RRNLTGLCRLYSLQPYRPVPPTTTTLPPTCQAYSADCTPVPFTRVTASGGQCCVTSTCAQEGQPSLVFGSNALSIDIFEPDPSYGTIALNCDVATGEDASWVAGRLTYRPDSSVVGVSVDGGPIQGGY